MTGSDQASGILFENRIVIWTIEEARRLYREGFYGKPLGIPKPKNSDFDSPLILDPMEGLYLSEKGKLRILSPSGRRISVKGMRRLCAREYVDFDAKYLAYTRLRESGLVVSPGIKFGCDFAIYEHGPGIDHAPYLVQVMEPEDRLTATGIVLAGRLATTVRKQFIIAAVDRSKESVTFIGFDWWRA